MLCLLYLKRVLRLLRDIRSVGVLRWPKLLLLAIRDEHWCKLIALVRDEQLGPLGTKRTCYLRVQVHQLWSEQHIRLLLQHKLGQYCRRLEKKV